MFQSEFAHTSIVGLLSFSVVEALDTHLILKAASWGGLNVLFTFFQALNVGLPLIGCPDVEDLRH